MCGILAILGDEICDNYICKLKKLIDARGPDDSSPVSECETQCGLKLRVAASVLHLRGKQIEKQPVVDEVGNVLLFNGQIYEYDGQVLDTNISDTLFLAKELKNCATKASVAEALSKIDGPFAVIFWSNSLRCLFYGRDFFGRKSLCALNSGNDAELPLMISSVSSSLELNSGMTWREVDSRGFHCLDFSQPETKRSKYMWNIDDIYPRTDKCEQIRIDPDVEIIYSLTYPFPRLNQDPKPHDDFSDSDFCNVTNELERLLLEAVAKRLKYNKVECLICRRDTSRNDLTCTHSKIAVAFSGGIDSTMLALALHRVFDESETIDLITVAFKDESPDRMSVAEAFKELRQLCPERNWRLVICDISLSVLQSERDRIIRHLILPCNTVVDDGLGCGCWFISRASGRSLDSSMQEHDFESIFGAFTRYDPDYNPAPPIPDEINLAYQSPASMLYAGMGIDEQLGGYTSHRAAWSKGGVQGALNEISFQMRRIPTRNLGRDDRTFSHHGRDVKLPFLDHDFVSFLNKTPVGLKMNFNEPQGTGPKKLLRTLAKQWGLVGTSCRVKRALQFGTRIACLEDANEKGCDVCSRLQDNSSSLH